LRKDGWVLCQFLTFYPSGTASGIVVCFFFWLVLVVKVRSFLRNRAGLPSVVVGAGILNQGHRSLYERELALLHDLLPKDNDIHDGLHLIDGADESRSLACPPPSSETLACAQATPPAGSVPTAPAGSVPTAPAGSVSTAPAGSVSTAPAFSLPDAPTGPVLPSPPHAVSLAPLPPGVPVLPGSQAAREAERTMLPPGVPVLSGSQAAREAERMVHGDWDEEEDDEIRPVANEYAAQWGAYRAARR